MAAHRHTVAAKVEGYEQLQITHDLSLTPRQIDVKQAAGQIAPTIVDFPNWEQVADACGLLAIDPDTGERNGAALPKPALPLTVAAFDDLPLDLGSYLQSITATGDALADYQATRLPFLRRA